MATSQVETVNTGADKAKLAAVAALVIASVAGFYLLSKQGAIAQWAALIVGLVAAAAVFLVSEPGRQFVAFCARSLARSQEGRLAHPQGDLADDGLRVCVCRHHGALPVVHRQDPRMASVRPRFGLEEVTP